MDAAGRELWICAQQGRVAEIEKKAAHCKFIDVWQAAAVAAWNDEAEAVAALMRKQPKLVFFTGREEATLLQCAAVHGSIETAKALLRARASLNYRNVRQSTAVAKAAQAGHVAMVQLLLLASADVEVSHDGIHTPLSTAVQHGQVAVLQVLLAAKVSANLRTPHGQPPLWWSAYGNCSASTQLLLDAKADINGAGRGSPVGVAAARNHVNVVRMLLSAKADVDATDPVGCTPIAYAARNGREHAVEVLLEARANVNRRTNSGRTPVFLATEWDLPHIVRRTIQDVGNYAGTSRVCAVSRSGSPVSRPLHLHNP